MDDKTIKKEDRKKIILMLKEIQVELAELRILNKEISKISEDFENTIIKCEKLIL